MNHLLQRRLLRAALLAGLLLAGLTACAPSQAPAALAPVTACSAGMSGAHIVTWYALDKGLFWKHGLDVRYVTISGGSKAATALIAGDVDLCQMGGIAVATAALAGEDLVMVGGLYNVFLYSLIVKPTISSVEDLRGKTLASDAPGGITEFALLTALQKLGLNAPQDVTLLNVGDDGARLAALESGRVDGALITMPQTLAAQQRGYRELVDLSALPVSVPYTGIATSRRFLQAHPDRALAFMRAITEAIATMKRDPVGTRAVWAQRLSLDETSQAASLQAGYELMIAHRLAEVPYPRVEAMQAMLDFLQPQSPRPAHRRAEDLVDRSLVAELERSGFIAGLYRRTE